MTGPRIPIYQLQQTVNDSIVIMGVAGCGKSSVASALADSCGLQYLEGDDFHPESSRQKMGRGEALNDSDRDGWLATVCEQLKAHPHGAVLTCSALKKAYRDRLRNAAPGLRFVFLDISVARARARVFARSESHFFAATLVDSQFATLEPPKGEPGVLQLDAMLPLIDLESRISRWLETP